MKLINPDAIYSAAEVQVVDKVTRRETCKVSELDPDTFYRSAEVEARCGKTLSRLLLGNAKHVVQGVYRGKELHEAYDALLDQTGGIPATR